MKLFRTFLITILVLLIFLVSSMFKSTPKVWQEVYSSSSDHFIFNLNSIQKKLLTFTNEDISKFKDWRPDNEILNEEYLYLFIWKTLFFENGDTTFPKDLKLSKSGKDLLKFWLQPFTETDTTNFLNTVKTNDKTDPYDLYVIRLLVSLPNSTNKQVLNKLKKYIDPENSIFKATGIYGEEMLEVIRYIVLKSRAESSLS